MFSSSFFVGYKLILCHVAYTVLKSSLGAIHLIVSKFCAKHSALRLSSFDDNGITPLHLVILTFLKVKLDITTEIGLCLTCFVKARSGARVSFIPTVGQELVSTPSCIIFEP